MCSAIGLVCQQHETQDGCAARRLRFDEFDGEPVNRLGGCGPLLCAIGAIRVLVELGLDRTRPRPTVGMSATRQISVALERPGVTSSAPPPTATRCSSPSGLSREPSEDCSQLFRNLRMGSRVELGTMGEA